MDEMASYFPPPPPSAFPNSSSYSSYYTTPPPLAAPPLSEYQHHYSQPYHHEQQYQSYPSSYGPPQDYYDDGVKTLFIAGLPEDVKPREIYNLFREFPGYQSSQLRRATEKTQPYGFAVFKDQHSAVAAMQALNGLVFDLEKHSTLYIDLAKSNSRSKRSRTDDGRFGSFDKKVKGSVSFPRDPPETGVGSNIHMPGIGNSAHNMIGYSSTQSYGFDTGAGNGTDSKHTSTPPCPTLFVANLGPACTDLELNQVFSRCPGFLKLKMQNKNGLPVAFVDFQDIESSSAALSNLQDSVLHSSTGEGMRLEYAKSRMGMRKKP